MHRINTFGSVNGRFKDGDPRIGQPATRLSAAWLNDLQEAIAYPIEEAGFALEAGRADQLYRAIAKLVQDAIGATDDDGNATGMVPTTRQITGSGLASGGGALDQDRAINVAAASPAEIAAGTRDDVAITPFGLAGGLAGRRFQADGYVTMPGGFIMQWGRSAVPPNSQITITLPIAFPLMCAFAGVEGGTMGRTEQENNPFVTGTSATQISVYSARDQSNAINWFAGGF